jgi:hypothetical protein
MMFGFPNFSTTFLAIEDAAEVHNAQAVQAPLDSLSTQAEAATGQLRSWIKAQRAKG